MPALSAGRKRVVEPSVRASGVRYRAVRDHGLCRARILPLVPRARPAFWVKADAIHLADSLALGICDVQWSFDPSASMVPNTSTSLPTGSIVHAPLIVA
jgi:hypothetical protein